MIRRIPILSFFVSAMMFITVAQERKTLTVEECIAAGLQNSNAMQISKAKMNFAAAKSEEIDASGLPTLKYFGGYTRLSYVDPFKVQFAGREMEISPSLLDNIQSRLTLQQPVFSGFRISANSQIMELNADASKEDFRKDKSQLILDIKNAYWSYFKAIEFKKVIEQNIVQMQAHLADIENFAKQGLATTNDVLKVKVQYSNIGLMKIDADMACQLAELGLNSTIGLPLSTKITLASKVNTKQGAGEELSSVVARSFEARPELKGMELRLKASEAGVAIARSGWYPQVNVAGNFYYNKPNQRIMPSKDEFINTWDIGVTVSYDIWNWQTASHQTDQALATLEQSRYGMSQLKDAITLEVTQTVLNLRKANEKVTAAEGVVGQAEENLRVVNGKFRSGLAINSEVLDAEIALLQAQMNYTTALVDVELAAARLDRVLGKESN